MLRIWGHQSQSFLKTSYTCLRCVRQRTIFFGVDGGFGRARYRTYDSMRWSSRKTKRNRPIFESVASGDINGSSKVRVGDPHSYNNYCKQDVVHSSKRTILDEYSHPHIELLRKYRMRDSLRLLKKKCKQIKRSEIPSIFCEVLQVCLEMLSIDNEDVLEEYVNGMLRLLEKLQLEIPHEELTESICEWFHSLEHRGWKINRTVINDTTNNRCTNCEVKPEELDKLAHKMMAYVKALHQIDEQVARKSTLSMNTFEYAEYREKLRLQVRAKERKKDRTPKTSIKSLKSEDASRELCVFEYFEENSCPFKRCVGSHVISDEQRNDPELQIKMLEKRRELEKSKTRKVHGQDLKNRAKSKAKSHAGDLLSSTIDDNFPKNMLKLERYLYKEGPFDVVVDQLNICYDKGTFDPTRLKHVVEHFLERDKRVLVVASGSAAIHKHLLSGSNAGPGSDRHLSSNDMDLHEVFLDLTLNKNCGLFFADHRLDSSADDRCILHALAYYNFEMDLVTNDLFRDALEFFDGRSQETFQKWQAQHQYILQGFNCGRPLFKPWYSGKIQEHASGWHVPINENDLYCISKCSE